MTVDIQFIHTFEINTNFLVDIFKLVSFVDGKYPGDISTRQMVTCTKMEDYLLLRSEQ
jgi:hypothetical protein